ncbi:hypothetical protein GGS26DRAFT_566345 [Hypomontagnella submonticulosa]|nr:hypothetical protein GGS26DRAFT_566345 [Hypomontagnella submonticulosa]
MGWAGCGWLGLTCLSMTQSYLFNVYVCFASVSIGDYRRPGSAPPYEEANLPSSRANIRGAVVLKVMPLLWFMRHYYQLFALPGAGLKERDSLYYKLFGNY